ncbi:hypothetical protein [Marinobacter shengliensis]|uniref:hypothetical protein n=1 Tax=Marinobacter shengliensis TaxID=1389223 RepID=UPI001E3736F9|nr:hypothetical protein [Marinobacter shengliensis]MCD1630702.1 hypothetical protein [Marinobacter shengliensis]
MAISARQRLLVSAVCASSLFLLSACGGDESSSDAAQNSEQRPSPGNPATPPGKTTKPYAYENTRFAFANGCYKLQADGRFISESSGQAYGVTSDSSQAARFYLIAAQGGITASFGGTRENWVDKLVRDGNRPRPDDQKVGPFGGAGFASDVNGIAQLANNPGSAEDEARLYPFSSVDGRVIFHKQKTGDREFGLYDGRGVAHYGLYPDQIADMMLHSDRPQELIDDAVNQLFTSAEAYLRMWERIENAPL